MTSPPVPPRVTAAEVRATTIIAIAKALVEAADEFGLGDEICGDAMKFATAAFGAAAPHLAGAERERCAQLADRYNAMYAKACLREDCRNATHYVHFAGLLRRGGEGGCT